MLPLIFWKSTTSPVSAEREPEQLALPTTFVQLPAVIPGARKVFPPGPLNRPLVPSAEAMPAGENPPSRGTVRNLLGFFSPPEKKGLPKPPPTAEKGEITPHRKGAN